MIKDYFLNSKSICQKKIINYAKGSIVFSEGDNCDILGIVVSGKIVVSTLTQNDKEYVITILEKNDIFGDTLLFSKNNRYLGDGIAVNDSIVLYVNKEQLLKEFMKNKSLLEEYLNYTSSKTLFLKNQVKLLSQKNIRERILFYLSLKSKELNTKRIPIKSKESLAQFLSIPRPSLSRELINMKNEGLIEFNRKFITIK